MQLIQLLDLAQCAAMANILLTISAEEAQMKRDEVQIATLVAGQEDGMAYGDSAQCPSYPLLDAYYLTPHYTEGFRQGVLQAALPEEEPDYVIYPDEIEDPWGDETFAYTRG